MQLMKFIYTIFLCFFSVQLFAFEGIIHCRKIENGNTSTFDFYMRGNAIAMESKGPDGNFKIIVDANRQFVTICVDHPEFNQKGYYIVTKEDAKVKDSVIVHRKSQTDVFTIDGEPCDGYTISTNIGSAIAYFSSENINLMGLSKFFNDPIYELIDAFGIQRLPKKIIVKKQHTSYTIDLSAEAKTLDNAVFEIPAGYVQFQVTAE